MNESCPKCGFGADDKSQWLEAHAWRELVAFCLAENIVSITIHGTFFDQIKSLVKTGGAANGHAKAKVAV